VELEPPKAFVFVPAVLSEPACAVEPAVVPPAVLPAFVASLPSSLAQPPAPANENSTTHTAAPATALFVDMRDP
jgi:hypothetical protein